MILRSMFFVPAHIDKFFDNAIGSEADALVFDLEDGVPIDQKKSARESLRAKLSSIKISQPIFIRLNAKETGLLEEDAQALALSAVAGFVVPKVRNVADILYFDNILLALEKKNGLKEGKFVFFPLIETAESALNILAIAKASKRIRGLIFGHEDYLLDIQGEHAVDNRNLLVPRSLLVMAARAAGCSPIDTPYLDIKNLAGCAKHVIESRELGFDGMLVLHPGQIKVANEGYFPSEEEIAQAEKILLINEEAQKNGRNIAFSEGKFMAPPILKQAKLLLERAKSPKK